MWLCGPEEEAKSARDAAVAAIAGVTGRAAG
jgi:hypothetical protein